MEKSPHPNLKRALGEVKKFLGVEPEMYGAGNYRFRDIGVQLCVFEWGAVEVSCARTSMGRSEVAEVARRLVQFSCAAGLVERILATPQEGDTMECDRTWTGYFADPRAIAVMDAEGGVTGRIPNAARKEVE